MLLFFLLLLFFNNQVSHGYNFQDTQSQLHLFKSYGGFDFGDHNLEEKPSAYNLRILQQQESPSSVDQVVNVTSSKLESGGNSEPEDNSSENTKTTGRSYKNGLNLENGKWIAIFTGSTVIITLFIGIGLFCFFKIRSESIRVDVRKVSPFKPTQLSQISQRDYQNNSSMVNINMTERDSASFRLNDNASFRMQSEIANANANANNPQ